MRCPSGERKKATLIVIAAHTRSVNPKGVFSSVLMSLLPQDRPDLWLAYASCVQKEPAVEETIKHALDEIDTIQIPLRQKDSQRQGR